MCCAEGRNALRNILCVASAESQVLSFPVWKSCTHRQAGCDLQYRLVSNYRDPKFLLGRIVDKLLCCVVLIILYAGRGKDASPDNLINISSLLYMYTVLPGFAAISYMPGLVLERPLYIRHATGAPALLGLYSQV